MHKPPVAESTEEAGWGPVRTLRVEVSFPDLRKTDRERLYHELWGAGDDLRRAANRAMTAFWQLRQGLLPWPEREKGGKTEPVPEGTLAYQALSGVWQPWGKPLYAPEGRAVSGGAKADLGQIVYTRFVTDYKDVRAGRKSLATFKQMPIGTYRQGVEILPNLDVVLKLWEGGGRVRVRPRGRRGRLDPGTKAITRCLVRSHQSTSAPTQRQPETPATSVR